MTFYINQEELDAHAEELARQIRDMHDLRDRLTYLTYSCLPEESGLLYSSIRKLNALADCFAAVRNTLMAYRDDTAAYSIRLSQELREMQQQAKNVFS